MRERRELKREKRGKTDSLEDGTNELPLAHMQLIFGRFDGSICRRTICIGHENMSRPHIDFCYNLSSRSSVMTLHGHEGGSMLVAYTNEGDFEPAR